MSQSPDPFVEHVLELLRPLGRVHSKRMFGGHGIYVNDAIMGLIASDRLYLKADDPSRAHFEAAGCKPFTYHGKGRPVIMSYWEAPSDALDDCELMRPWAEVAIAAARRAAVPKPKRQR